jgi:hypothetical protein
MKKHIILSTLAMGMTFLCQKPFAQGCVAFRQFSCVGNTVGQSNLLQKSECNISANYHFFKSFKHFCGSHEEPELVEKGIVVINRSYSIDFNIPFAFSERLYESVSFPFAYIERSSFHENGITERCTFLSFSGFYMFNYRNTNGNENNRSRANESIMSVPDLFGFSAGAFQNISTIHGLGILLGGRIVGASIRDVIGFRRQEYVIPLNLASAILLVI